MVRIVPYHAESCSVWYIVNDDGEDFDILATTFSLANAQEKVKEFQ